MVSKKRVGVFVIVILFLSLFAISSLAIIAPDIDVTLISQSPDPVEPGQIVKVKFEIENTGDDSTDDITAILHVQYPFTLYGDTAVRNLGKIRNTVGGDTVVIEYDLKIDEGAVEGEQKITLEIDEGQASILFEDLTIDIQTHDAVLEISSIDVTPNYISPGESATIDIMVKNLADSLLKDIIFDLDFEDTDLPLAPFQGSSERRIAQLQKDFQKSLQFQVIAEPGASQGIYKVPITITYNDEKGNSYNTTDILALQIGKTPDLRVHVTKTTMHSAKVAGTMTIEIANSGVSDVKYVELELIESDEYTLISPTNYFYIGDIDSDDTETEEISVYVTTKENEASIPARITYSDGNNVEYERIVSLTLPLYSNRELKKFGLVEKDTSALTYIIILLLLGGGAYYYKKKKKDQKKK